MKALVLIAATGLVALGCQKSEPAAPPAASAVPVAAPAAPAATSAAADPATAPAVDTSVALSTAAPAVAAKAVPTEADYEVQAQSTITPTNAAQVLAAIDKQVGN